MRALLTSYRLATFHLTGISRCLKIAASLRLGFLRIFPRSAPCILLGRHCYHDTMKRYSCHALLGASANFADPERAMHERSNYAVKAYSAV
jgi:hypothetical protein